LEFLFFGQFISKRTLPHVRRNLFSNRIRKPYASFGEPNHQTEYRKKCRIRRSKHDRPLRTKRIYNDGHARSIPPSRVRRVNDIRYSSAALTTRPKFG